MRLILIYICWSLPIINFPGFLIRSTESSLPEVVCATSILKNLQECTCAGVSFLIKLYAESWKSATVKMRFQCRCFPLNFGKLLRTPILYRISNVCFWINITRPARNIIPFSNFSVLLSRDHGKCLVCDYGSRVWGKITWKVTVWKGKVWNFTKNDFVHRDFSKASRRTAIFRTLISYWVLLHRNTMDILTWVIL